jgi:hypothetical protein
LIVFACEGAEASLKPFPFRKSLKDLAKHRAVMYKSISKNSH